VSGDAPAEKRRRGWRRRPRERPARRHRDYEADPRAGVFKDAGGRESVAVSPQMRRTYQVFVVALVALLGLSWVVGFAKHASIAGTVAIVALLAGAAYAAWRLLDRA
jgi:hypothetical protein